MKIALISLISPKHTVLAENYGVSVLAGFIQSEFGSSIQLEVVDQQFSDLQAITKKLTETPYDIIGLSVPIGGLPSLEAIMSFADRFSASAILLGGVLPSHAPKELLRKFEDPRVVVCRGEGEETFRSLISQLLQGELNLELLPNISFTDAEKVYVANPTRLFRNLNQLPLPDRTNARRISKLGGQIYIEASRGCSWDKCTFCAIREKGLNRRWFTAEKIVEKMEQCRHFVNPDQDIVFTDEEFIGNDSHSLEILHSLAQKLIKKKSSVSFTFATRVESIINSKDSDLTAHLRGEVFLRLVEAGLSSVFIGVESGSNGQLKRFGKGAKVADNLSAISKLKTYGIRLDIGIILFDPLMTIEEIIENIEFVEDSEILGLISVLPHEIRVQKNTPLHAMCTNWERKNGRKLIGELDLNSLNYPITNYADESVGRIAKMAKSWHEDYYELWYALKGRIRSLSDGSTRRVLMKFYAEIQTIEAQLIKALALDIQKTGSFDLAKIETLRMYRLEVLNQLSKAAALDSNLDPNRSIRTGILDFSKRIQTSAQPAFDEPRHHQLV